MSKSFKQHIQENKENKITFSVNRSFFKNNTEEWIKDKFHWLKIDNIINYSNTISYPDLTLIEANGNTLIYLVNVKILDKKKLLKEIDGFMCGPKFKILSIK